MPTVRMIVRVAMAAAAVAVVASVIVIVVADRRRVGTALVDLHRAATGLAVDFVLVVKADRRAVMVTTGVVRRAVLVIVTAAQLHNASGWRFQRTCRSSFTRMTRRWTRWPRM